MPYLGVRDGEEVIPPQVAGGTIVQCPVCEDEMYVKQSHYRNESFVSRHFVHKSDDLGGGNEDSAVEGSGDCPGESDTHLKMKSIAYARLEEDYPDAHIELEGHVSGRFADVLLTFTEPRAPYGKGIAVEAQYQNKGKDIEGATEHYFQNSYSVAWVEEDDFTNHDVDLSGTLTLWPNALPDRNGMDGYPATTRWLWQEKNAPVEREIPIPGEYWTSFDESDDWTVIAERDLKGRERGKRPGTIRLVKSPTGDITLRISKATPSGGEGVTLQVFQSDVRKLKSFADGLEQNAFGDGRPDPVDCESEWHDLTTTWLTTGNENIISPLTATLPNPTSDVVLQFGKRRYGDWDRVRMKIHPYAVESFREIANILDRVLEIEAGNEPMPNPLEVNSSKGPAVAAVGQPTLWKYCLSCSSFTSHTQNGVCAACESTTVVRTLFRDHPSGWTPALAESSITTYRHTRDGVEVTIPIPGERYGPDEELVYTDPNAGEDPRPDTYSALVKWPHDIEDKQQWVTPLTRVIEPEQAKTWVRGLLNTIHQKETPGGLSEKFQPISQTERQ